MLNWLVTFNPTWMHTAEYINGYLKFELLFVALLWCVVSIGVVYLSSFFKRGWVINVGLLSASVPFWVFYVLSFAQRWIS